MSLPKDFTRDDVLAHLTRWFLSDKGQHNDPFFLLQWSGFRPKVLGSSAYRFVDDLESDPAMLDVLVDEIMRRYKLKGPVYHMLDKMHWLVNKMDGRPA